MSEPPKANLDTNNLALAQESTINQVRNEAQAYWTSQAKSQREEALLYTEYTQYRASQSDHFNKESQRHLTYEQWLNQRSNGLTHNEPYCVDDNSGNTYVDDHLSYTFDGTCHDILDEDSTEDTFCRPRHLMKLMEQSASSMSHICDPDRHGHRHTRGINTSEGIHITAPTKTTSCPLLPQISQRKKEIKSLISDYNRKRFLKVTGNSSV